MSFFFLEKIQTSSLTEQLLEVIKFCSQNGWTPATSSNFSYKTDEWEAYKPENPGIAFNPIIITRSGLDKSKLSIYDFTVTDPEGMGLEPNTKPSMDAILHALIYQKFPDARVVLHCHSHANTVLSKFFSTKGYLEFQGYELLKALDGIHSHDTPVRIPIFADSRDIKKLSEVISNYFDGREADEALHAFLLSSHGIYVWGKDFDAAKRHLEVFEFLFTCEIMMRSIEK